jgi:hypothetical protein
MADFSSRPGPPAERAGYSGTPLARKLGVKANQCLLIYAAPPGWTVPGLPEGISVVTAATRADIVVAFCRHALEVASQAQPLSQVIVPAGSLWLAWPRRAGGHTSDITDNVIRQIVLPLGLVDVKVAALDHDWSGLKVVWRKELRTG